MRYSTLILFSALVLSACGQTTQPPASGAGFKSYEEYVREREAREAALRGEYQVVQPPERTATASSDTEALVNDANAAIATASDPAETPDQSEADAALTEEERLARAEISDEQDFDAVSSRESIESDAERIAANRQQYVVIEPTDLPKRPGNLGPSIVDFALATNNPVGQPLYSRLTVLSQTRFNRNCAKYSSPDLAQEDFLAKGGPTRDRMGLDPDGDGFACYWNPTPFRAARRAASGN